MKLLVDTHVFLWALSNDRRLTPALRRAVETARDPRLSVVSIFEIEQKAALGKLAVAGEATTLARRMGYQELPLRWAHAREAARLPLLHRDPFDRMLIAQARIEGLTLATADRNIRRYDVATVG